MRTLILGHDKRMLAVLGRPALIGDLVSAADADVLLAATSSRRSTHAIGRSRCELRADPAGWVLKRNSSGRGMDLLVGAACPPGAMAAAAVEHEAHDRAAQRFVEQLVMTMPMLTADGELVDGRSTSSGCCPGSTASRSAPGCSAPPPNR